MVRTMAREPERFGDVCQEGSCNVSHAPLFVHHLRSRRALQLLNKHALRYIPRTKAPRLFCWTWVRPDGDRGAADEQSKLPEVRELYTECDGWAIFSNFNDPKRNITKAHEGPSGGNGRSAIQFHSVLDRLVHDPVYSGFDWYVSLEPDHFVQLRLLRRALGSTEKPVDLKIWTIRICSAQFLSAVREQWSVVGRRRENGCPSYSPERILPFCQGDVSMPRISYSLNATKVLGAFPSAVFTSGYFEMQRIGPGWDKEEVQVQFLCELFGLGAEPLCAPTSKVGR